jgi:hypothetical protein
MSTEFLSPNWRMPRNANQSKSSNYSLNFQGSDVIEVPLTIDGLSSVTMSVWFKTSASQTSKYLLSFPRAATNNGFDINFNSQQIRSFLSGSSGSFSTLSSTFTYTDGNWHHVAVSYDGTSHKMYIDGVLTALNSVSYGTINNTTGMFYIGAFNVSGSSPVSGIDEIDTNQVAVFDYALSDGGVSVNGTATGQIAQLYGNGYSLSNPMALPSTPIAYYPLGTSAWNGQYLAENNAIGDYVFDFDGSSYIDCGAISVIPSATQLSVSFWANTDSTSQNQVVFGDNSSTPIFSFEYWGSINRMYFEYGSNLYAYLTLTSVVTAGSWHNVVLVYNASGASNTDKIKIYVDGVDKSSSMSYNGTIPSSLNANIGDFWIGNGQNYNSPFNGEMSNVQVFNSALSGPEATTLYNYGSPIQTLANIPQNSNLKAWYKLDATDIYDNSTTKWNNIEAKANNKGSMLCGYNAWSGQALVQSYNSPVERSISIWVRRTASMGYSGVCNQQGVGGAQAYSQFFVWSNRGYTMSFFVPSPNKWVDFGYMAPDTWYHAVLTDTGVTAAGRFKTYWNGEFANSSTDLTYDLGTFANGFKWAGGGGVGLWSGGSIADGRLFDTVLSASEVETLYNNGAPSTLNNVKPNNLKQWLTFENIDTSVGGGLYDKSGNNNQLTTPLYPWVAARAAGNLNVPISALNGLSTGMSQTNLVQSDLQTVASYSKYAMNFDVSDYIDLTSQIVLTSELTISCWIKSDGAVVYGITAGYNGSADSWYRFYPAAPGGNRVDIMIDGSSTEWNFANGGTPIQNGVWQHYLLKRDSSNIWTFYLDNVKYTTNQPTISGSFRVDTFCRIYSSSPRYFDGVMSNMAIWNTSLSDSQVREVYNQGLPGNLSSFSGTAPIHWWQLGEVSSYAGGWIFADEIGSINGEGQNLAETDLTNGVGTTANGVSTGMSEGSLVGDAPYSTANAISSGMPVTAIGTDVP